MLRLSVCLFLLLGTSLHAFASEPWNGAAHPPSKKHYFELLFSTHTFSSYFRQSNISSTFTQTGVGGDFRLSFNPPSGKYYFIWLRNSSALISTRKKYSPPLTFKDNVVSYNSDIEIQYAIIHPPMLQIRPLIGGWLFFMYVQSHSFGLQRVLNPIFGIQADLSFNKNFFIEIGTRVAPLQGYDIFNFKSNNSYLEIDSSINFRFNKRWLLFINGKYESFDHSPAGTKTKFNAEYTKLGLGVGLKF